MTDGNIRVKLCNNPNCWEVNPSNLAQCKACGTSLINVKAVLKEKVDVEISKKRLSVEDQSEMASTKEATIERMVRICDCGYHNLANLRICEKCGEEISDIIPVCENETEKEYLLETLDCTYSYRIIYGNTIIGREHKMQEYLLEKEFVGRKHAEIQLEEKQLMIKDLNSVNGVFVNNEAINPNEWYSLENGDEVALGGKVIGGERQDGAAYFIVKVN